jgi:hypothetical protein
MAAFCSLVVLILIGFLYLFCIETLGVRPSSSVAAVLTFHPLIYAYISPPSTSLHIHISYYNKNLAGDQGGHGFLGQYVNGVLEQKIFTNMAYTIKVLL